MNKGKFFDIIRHTVFGGHLTSEQVYGLEKILDYKFAFFNNLLNNQFANILAQCTWETARRMTPICEYGDMGYLQSRPYFPWYGRGLIQITWQENYMKFGITNAEDALQWGPALDIMFRGMTVGMFTRHKLAEFLNADLTDFYHAREVVNGLDKAHLIEAISISYLKALEASGV